MKYLLDTHVLLWLRLSPKKLSTGHRAIIESPDDEKFVSSISAWEISLKFSLGKLKLGSHTPAEFLISLERTGVRQLAPSFERYATYHQLPALDRYKDPFDRMLAWQAIGEGFTLVSSDPRMDGYRAYGLKLAL
jgi:PIN domain nuclease of toxin-antitoxin system